MAQWASRWFKRGNRKTKTPRHRRFFFSPEQLESRQLLATWSGDIADGTVWGSGLQEITGNVHIPAGATLTIQPGAVVKFDTGHDWKIDVDGRLLAQGTAGSPIYFTSMADDTVGGTTSGGSTPAANQWESINFKNPNTTSVLDNVVARYGGENAPGEVVANGGGLTLSNSTLAGCGSAGIRIIGSTPTLTNVTFANNAVAASMDVASNPAITGVTMTGNGRNGLLVDGGTLAADNSWANADIPYLLVGPVTVAAGKTLTVQPGVVVKFDAGRDFFIQVNGTLLAQGTAAKPIYFTTSYDDTVGGDTNGDGSATHPGSNQWESITFGSTSSGSILDHIEARYGGENAPGEIFDNGGGLTLSNSTLASCVSAGIRMVGAAPTLTNITFANNAVAASMDLASKPAITGVTMTGNGRNGLLVDGGTLAADNSWANADIPYLFMGSVTVSTGKILTIQPGVVVKFDAGRDFGIQVNGTLLAQGTVAKPIYFTTSYDDAIGGDTNGDGSATHEGSNQWESVTFGATSSGNVLDYVNVRFGGENVPGEIVVNTSQLSLTNSNVSYSNTAGVFIANADPTISGDVFKANAIGIRMDPNSNPAISGVSMLSNGIDGVRVDGGTLTRDERWDDPDVVYLVQDTVTVPLGKTLTIAPGQVLKFRSGSSVGLTVNGTLSAVGTASTPIYFTSSENDDLRGDTTGNGNQQPRVGDWAGLKFTSTSTSNLVQNAEIRYAGENGDAAVYSIGAPLSIADTKIFASASSGVRVEDVTDTLTNVVIQDSGVYAGYPAISVNLGGDITTSGVTATGNSTDAIVLDGGTLTASRSLGATGLPYQLGGALTINSSVTLTIGPGAIFEAHRDSFSFFGAGTIDNRGVIRKSTGSTVTFAPAVTNEGTIKPLVSVLNFAGGLTNAGGGSITGPIGPTISIGKNFDGTTQNVSSFSSLATILLNGAGTQATPQLFEALSADKGASGTGFERNFSLYSLTLSNSTYVQLVDNADNAAGSGAEAVYTANLSVPAGSTLDLNGLHLYARATQINGIVKNGTVTVLPDGGPLARDAFTPGKISAVGEIDDWTIFGRAGDSLTISLSTGDSGIAPPVNPQLLFGQLTLVGLDGKTVSTASNSAQGADVSLNAVTLPTDGTYHIRVQAPAAHAGATGDYVLTASAATVNMQPLQFGKTLNGRIDNAYASDRWTFSIAADQVVKFSLVNAESTGLQFDLSGPNGFSMNGLSNATAPIALHGAGTYAITVHGSQQQVGAYAFRLDQTAVAQLNLGTPLTLNIAGSGQSQLYELNVPQAQQLVITLTDANAADRNEVYVSQGTPPTRSDYQFKFETPASANQRVSIPSASAGTWYVLVFNENAPQAGSFTLKAIGGSTFLQGVTPSRGSTSSDTVVTLTGLGFDGTTTVQMVSGSNVVSATNVHLDLPTQITATFAAGAVAAGDYVVEINNQASTPPLAFTFVAGGQSKFVVSVDAPKGLGYHGIATFYLNYRNDGDAAMPAPLVTFTPTQTHKVNGAEVTEHNAFLTLDRSRIISGFSTSGLPDGFAHSIQLLASGNTPGTLQPGESTRVPIYWAGWQQPWDLSYPPFKFDIQAADMTDTTAVDWDALKAMVPSTFDPAARDAIWENVKSQMGSTLGSYVAALDKTAAYLGQFGEHVNSVSQLFEFQIDIANGLTIDPQLLTITDASSAASGISLSFARSFSSLVDGRNTLGLLGRGWAWLEGWDDMLTVDSDGSAVIRSASGKQAVFAPRPGGGYYILPPGDSGKLLGSAGNPWMLQETDGTVTAYRADGHVDYVRDPTGNQVSTTYTNGLLTKLTHSSGQTMQFTYNAAGRITSVTDNEGRVTQFGYDASNEHLITVTDSDGVVTSYTYDTSGNLLTQNALLSVAYPDGTHEFFNYDAQGRLSESQIDGNAAKVMFTYGPLGQVSETDALGATTTELFDYHGVVAQVEDPLHRRMFHIFDANGVLVATVDEAGQRTSYGYDDAGNLVSVTDPLGHTVHYEYNGLRGTMSKFTDAKGNSIRYVHAYSGQVTSTIYADGFVESSAFDPVGNLIRSTDRKGQATTFTYDSAGRILTQTFADNSSVTYTYDAHGNMTSAADSSNGTVTMVYDAHDQLKEIDYPAGKFLKYTYDTAGRRLQMTDQTGFVVNYAYDSAGRLGGLTDGSKSPIVSYTYDDVGQIARKDNGNGTYTIYDYDLAGELLHLINHAPDNSVSSRFDYTYDAIGDATSMSTLDGQWSYGYDSIGQLMHAVFVSNNPIAVPNQDLQYTYDAAGNRTSTIVNGVTTNYTANNLNQYTAVGTAALQYDRNGNLISKTDGSATTSYTYDVRDRLIAASAPGDNWSYQYDALGHLASETHNGQTIQNLVDDAGLGDVVAQFDGTGALIAHFTYGGGLVSRVGVGGEKAYYNFDANANTVALTGADGRVLNSYRYQPFGSLLTSSETIANPFKFDGQDGVRVTGSGLHFMRNRFYDATAGRFTQMDPIGIAGGLNLYAYAENNPIVDADPSGLTVQVGPPSEQLISDVAYELANLIQQVTGKSPIRKLAYYVPDAAGNAVRYFHNVVFSPQILLERALDSGVGKRVFSIRNLERVIGKEGIKTAVKTLPLGGGGRALAYRGGVSSFAANGSRLAGFLRGLLYSIAFGTGLEIGERWQAKRKFEDDFFNYMNKYHHTLLWTLEGAENFFSINLFSSDPNDKIGPGGAGPGNFVAGDAALPYRIDFENDPTATAPAQVVTVSDILSPNVDLDTFQLTGIKFGDTVLTPPPGSQYFAATVPLTQNGTTFNVLVEAGMHTDTREVYATFRSIDPATNLPPDVTFGFLPPEPAHVSDPVAEAATPGRGQGQGQITYSIKPLAGLPTGTKITNVAKIIFDENASIATDQVNPHDASAGSDPSKQALVTIINGPPKSHVIALTPKENDSFTAKWTGDDGLDGASLAKFDVFVSQDGGAFSQWQTGISGSSALYSGAVAGHTYAFYVVATDYVGQVESKTAAAETQTTISANPWQNAEKAPDVDHDGTAAPKDLTAIILQLNGFGAHDLPLTKPAGDFFYDVDGDHQVTPSDLVKVIIYLNSFGAGEGEPADRPVADSLNSIAVPAAAGTLSSVSSPSAGEPSADDLLALLASDVVTTPRRRPA